MRRPSLRLTAAVLLALTTVLVGFAHRPLRLDARGYGAAVAAYLLPDGSLPELCDHDDGVDDHGPVGGLVVAICDACLFTSAPGLGAVAEIVPAPIVDRPIGRVEIADERAEGVPPHDARARGPPSVS